MEVTVVAVLQAKPGMADRVIEAFAQVSPLVHNESGCELYAAHREHDGDSIVMIERWTSLEELQAHADGDPLRRLNELTEDILVKPYDVWFLEPVILGDPMKGKF